MGIATNLLLLVALPLVAMAADSDIGECNNTWKDHWENLLGCTITHIPGPPEKYKATGCSNGKTYVCTVKVHNWGKCNPTIEKHFTDNGFVLIETKDGPGPNKVTKIYQNGHEKRSCYEYKPDGDKKNCDAPNREEDCQREEGYCSVSIGVGTMQVTYTNCQTLGQDFECEERCCCESYSGGGRGGGSTPVMTCGSEGVHHPSPSNCGQMPG